MLANHWSTDANSKRDECLIGVLSPEGVKAMNEDAVRAAKELPKMDANEIAEAVRKLDARLNDSENVTSSDTSIKE